MAIFTSTAAENTRTRQTGGALRNVNDIREMINTFYDEANEEHTGIIDTMELGQLFRTGSQTKDVEVKRTKVRGNGTVPMNEDGDDFDFINFGLGWQYTKAVYQYRLAVKHTRHLSEVEGASGMATIQQEGQELFDASERTMRFMYADFWNRAVDPASGAQCLSPDGMYLIDSGRPNPVEGVPNWSNLETTGDLGDDLFFNAEINAANQIAHNGDRLRTKIRKIRIPRSYSKAMWQLDKSMKDPNSAMNTANWAAGKFPYEVHDEFDSNIILYELDTPASNNNPCEITWAVRPSAAPLTFEDPDIMGHRIRFRVGLNIDGDPRKMWRGGNLNAL